MKGKLKPRKAVNLSRESWEILLEAKRKTDKSFQSLTEQAIRKCYSSPQAKVSDGSFEKCDYRLFAGKTHFESMSLFTVEEIEKVREGFLELERLLVRLGAAIPEEVQDESRRSKKEV